MTVQLMLGDCLERMKEIPDGSVDMVLADPPYGTTACKWDSIIPLAPMWEQLKRVIKPNGAIVMTAAQPFTSKLVMSNPGWFKYDWVWSRSHKSGQLNAKKRPMVAHESILVFYKSQPKYCNAKSKSSPRAGKKATPTAAQAYHDIEMQDEYRRPDYISKDSVITGFPVDNRGLHPTQTPVALMEYLIKTYTNEGETVLDFTCGSGSTGVACVNTGRNFIGIELDPGYFEVAQQRIKEAQECLGKK